MAQIPAPTTPEGNLARAAGAYLGANEYIFRLKESQCGFAVQRVPPKYELLVLHELIAGFPVEKREEAMRVFSDTKPLIIEESRKNVSRMVEASLSDSNVDKKVSCGVLFGMLGAIAAQTQSKWLETKKIYGPK